MSGYRAALRVAFKNARRNKKRTFYLVALIALPVTVAVLVAAGVRAGHVTPEERATSEFGAATVKVEPWGDNADRVSEWVRGVVTDFEPGAGILEYRVLHRRLGHGGSGRILDVDLDNPLAEGILALTSGGVPRTPDEAVLTEHLAREMGVGIGDLVSLSDIGLEKPDFVVVGLASHPIMWRQEDVVVVPEVMDAVRRSSGAEGSVLLVDTDDEFALVETVWTRWQTDLTQFYPPHLEWPVPADLDFLDDQLYARLTTDDLVEVRSTIESHGEESAWYRASELADWDRVPELYVESKADRLSWSQTQISERAPVIGSAVAAVLLAEVAFIAGAAFAAGTRRRLREMGLLGSNGASTEHIRATVVGEGLVAGVVGAVAGVLVGVGLLVMGRPVLQGLVERRIEDFPLSMADLAGPVVLAVVACVLAAWLPAKTASTVPTLTALQGRMPASRPKTWVVPAGIALTAFGTLLFGVGLVANNSGGGGGEAAVALVGAILMIGGVALLAGPLVAWVSGLAERLPITARMVLRDSGRHRVRASAAVAATMVIVLAPLTILAASEASRASQAVYGLTPYNAQLLVEGRYDFVTGDFLPYSATDPTQAMSDLEQIETVVPGAITAQFLTIDMLVDYPAEWRNMNGTLPLDSQGGWWVNPTRIAIANDELLELLDHEPLRLALDRDGIVLIGVEDRMTEIGIDGVGVEVAEFPVAVPLYSFPRVLVTEEEARSFDGATTGRMAWVVAPDTSLNPFENPFREVFALGLDLNAQSSSENAGAEAVMAMIFVGTLLVVLIVVATITALSAVEADNDLQTVVAVGARNSIRRRYLGMQSFLHTLLGALLAIPLALLLVKTGVSVGSFVTVGNFGIHDTSTLYVPWLGIGVLLIALPLVVGLLTAVTVRSSPMAPPRRAF